MRNLIITCALMVMCAVLVSSCATLGIHTWPDDEKRVDAMIITVTQDIGEGIRTGALNIEQSQMFLRKVKALRKEAVELTNKDVRHEHWNDLHKRIDTVEEELNTAFATSGKVDQDSRSAIRLVKLQQDLDSAKGECRLPDEDVKVFQRRLDLIRSNYLKMIESDGTPVTLDEKADISRKLDSFTTDLNKCQ
jgi:hypothetical protein